MFPYPSGAGLHVGHPLGYIATDVIARYKRLKGYNVLHPMGFDSFGLPAEQYAIQTGQHPAITTETNINRYKEQLKAINGGSQKRCSTSCVGKPIGIVGACYHNGSCNCPGVCVQGGGGQPQCQSA